MVEMASDHIKTGEHPVKIPEVVLRSITAHVEVKAVTTKVE
jgi:hypothetical protein